MKSSSVVQSEFPNSKNPGILKLLSSLPKLRDDTLGFLENAAKQYGDLIHFRVGPLNAFVLSHPAYVQHILQDNNKNYTKDTFQYNGLSKVTGRGLLTSDGELWLQQRRRMQPAFHRKRIDGFGDLMTDAAIRKVGEWQAGQTIDVDREMMALALEILGKALLGVDLRTEAPILTSAVLVALDHVVHSFKSPDILPAFIKTPRRRKFKQAMDTLDKAVKEIINHHRSKNDGTMDAKSLLDVMLYSTDDNGKTMSDQQVRDEVITILIAGHETVASALTWACYLIASNPQVESQLQQEINQVLQGRSPTVEELPNLDFSRRVFDEALRLYPPAWLVTRKAVHDDEINGVKIPAGSLMVVSITNVHKNGKFWENPLIFDPDRFIQDESTDRPKFAYLPFGGGPRLCIGNHFALIEGPLVLATIYQKFSLRLQPDLNVKVDALVTLRPHAGLHMQVVKR